MTARTLYLGRHFFTQNYTFPAFFPARIPLRGALHLPLVRNISPAQKHGASGGVGTYFFRRLGARTKHTSRNNDRRCISGHLALPVAMGSAGRWTRRRSGEIAKKKLVTRPGAGCRAFGTPSRCQLPSLAQKKEREKVTLLFFFFCLRRALDSGPSAIPNFLYARYPKRSPQGPPKTPRPGSSQPSISPPKSRHEGGRCRLSRLNSVWGSELLLQWPTYLINSIISFAEIVHPL